MKYKLIILAFLIVCLLIPNVSTSFTDVRQWSAFNKSFTDSDGVIAATNFLLNNAPHGFTVVSRTSQITFTAHFTTTPANAGQIDEYSVNLIIKEGAITIITCDGISFSRLAIPDLGRFQSTFHSFCQGTSTNALIPGTTYTYETSVTMVTGTNHAVQVGYSISVMQVDSVTDSSFDSLALESTLTHIHNEQHNQHSITNTLINTTHANLTNFLTLIYNHELTICQKTIYSIDGCEGIIFDGNVTVNNTEVLTEIQTMDTEIGSGIALWFWLAIVTITVVLMNKENYRTNFILPILSLFGMFFAVNNFEGIFRTFGVAVGILLLTLYVWRVMKENEKKKGEQNV